MSKPNVILILNDDMGYSDIACYGGEIDTPNLDKLAAGGVRMSQSDADNGREFLVWEHEGNKAIRDGKYKAVSKHLRGWELYDIESDRSETNDIADQNRNIVRDLAARWNNWAGRVGAREFETLVYNTSKRAKQGGILFDAISRILQSIHFVHCFCHFILNRKPQVSCLKQWKLLETY